MTLEEVDPNAAPQSPTWSSHVHRIMVARCTACHSPNAQPGEVDGYSYETCADTRRGWGGIVETVFEEKSMPPGAADRLTSAEILTLKRWRQNGSPCE